MENVIVRIFGTNSVKKMASSSAMTQLLGQRYYATNPRDLMKKVKTQHPYRKIHPWKSLEDFSKSLIDGVIHNEDGLVALNKPYGISGKQSKNTERSSTGIVHNVDYTLEEAIPHIAKELNYSSLKLVKIPEKFTSGVAILAADGKVERLVEKALIRAQGMNLVPHSYWAVTTKVPNEMKGEKRLAMRMKQGPNDGQHLPIIVESWSHNEQKRRDIKILNVQFKVISNSTENLASLIEIKSSTKKWHALRLFAATVLYSPILGDNIYGSRVQCVMGKWMNISPFVEAAQYPPKLDRDLLQHLKLSPGKEAIIPVHLHLREVYLPMFKGKRSDLMLTAPPMPEFMWTCQRLKFKHELFQEDEEDDCEDDMNSETARSQVAV